METILTLGPAKYRFRILPGQGKCSAELYLNKAGRPVKCEGKAHVKMHDGKNLCLAHFDKVKEVIESQVEKRNGK